MKIETHRLGTQDWVPNNLHLPVVVYRQTQMAGAAAFEALFAAHGWPPQWRDGIYDYHHYHSTAHEVLGIAAGRARLMIGGPGALEITVSCGDALLLPAGTGHCCIEADAEFLVVGAYPEGQEWDICRHAPDEAARKRIASLPFPASDPVTGMAAPWQGA